MPSAPLSISNSGNSNLIFACADSHICLDISGYKSCIVMVRALVFWTSLSVRDPTPVDVSGAAQFTSVEILGPFATSRLVHWGCQQWENLSPTAAGGIEKNSVKDAEKCCTGFPSFGMRSNKENVYGWCCAFMWAQDLLELGTPTISPGNAINNFIFFFFFSPMCGKQSSCKCAWDG